jgi:5'-3' exonuclease
MDVHLVDGTYELFRAFYAKVPGHLDGDGVEVGAVRGVVMSMVSMLDEGATHLGVATDHVIESFRNDLWEGYKTGEGIDPVLLAQFPLLEEALAAFGFTVWAMVEQEADDALAAAAHVAVADARVGQVVICTPDKDLGQCVGGKVVQLDRRNRRLLDSAAVREKFGVDPESIPDYLALVGDSADGFPGLPGWGAKSAAALLGRYGHIEQIPADPRQWDVPVRSAAALAETLHQLEDLALHFRLLATLRVDAPVGTVDAWEWTGPVKGYDEWSARLGSDSLARRVAARVAARDKGSA